MGKRQFKPGNMLYPVPAVLVTAADREGNSNIFTVAWAGTICTNPPMLSISVRPERHSYHMIRETGEFVVNLTTESTDLICTGQGAEQLITTAFHVADEDVENVSAQTGIVKLPGVVSRKKQLAPQIMMALQ